MMKIYYESNEGVKLDLLKRPYRLQTGDLFDFQWEYESEIYGDYGGRITKFKRGVQTKKLTLSISSSNEVQYYDAINRFCEATEKDILNRTPGKLYVGNQFLSCYIYASAKSDWEYDCDMLDNEISLVTENPFWITKSKQSFQKYDESGSNQYLDFPYDFSYDFTGDQKGISVLQNDHYAASHFQMIFYGPVMNPMIIIGGHTYVVNTTVEENEYLTIDSKARSVIRTMANGTQVNEFNNRGFEQSVFELIPPGEVTVNWSGDFGFDIILLSERSEPKWIRE